MHSECIPAGHCLRFLFCAPVYCIDAFSYLKISELFPWYTTLQPAQKTSPCLTKEYLHDIPQHREPLVPSLDICDWEEDLEWEVLTSSSLGKTSNEWSCACGIQLDCSSQGPLASRAGWDRLTPVLHTPPAAPLLPFHVGASQNSQLRKYSKGKYILEDWYKFLSVWRTSWWLLYQCSLSCGRRGGVFVLSPGQQEEVTGSHTARMKCFSWYCVADQ